MFTRRKWLLSVLAWLILAGLALFVCASCHVCCEKECPVCRAIEPTRLSLFCLFFPILLAAARLCAGPVCRHPGFYPPLCTLVSRFDRLND